MECADKNEVWSPAPGNLSEDLCFCQGHSNTSLPLEPTHNLRLSQLALRARCKCRPWERAATCHPEPHLWGLWGLWGLGTERAKTLTRAEARHDGDRHPPEVFRALLYQSSQSLHETGIISPGAGNKTESQRDHSANKQNGQKEPNA